MKEYDSAKPARSRWTTRISIALAAIAALVVVVSESARNWLKGIPV